MVDVFEAKYKIPGTVNFIASGPKGAKIAQEIDGFNITVNASVLLPKVPHLFISKDPEIIYKPWWNDAYNRAQKFGTIKLFSDRLANIDQSGVGHWQKQEYHPNYTFVRTNLGSINSNTTISGVAIHLAVLLGARHIKLCGLDFDGVNNFNSRNVRANWNFKTHLQSIQKLINFLKSDYKVKFESLSPTKLIIV